MERSVALVRVAQRVVPARRIAPRVSRSSTSMLHGSRPRKRECSHARDVRPALGRRDAPLGKIELRRGHPPVSAAPRMTLSMRRVVPTRAAIDDDAARRRDGRGLERIRIDHCEVLHLHRIFGRDHRVAELLERRRGTLAGVEGVAHGKDRPREHTRALAVGWAQVRVATRQRDAVGLAYRRRDVRSGSGSRDRAPSPE